MTIVSLRVVSEIAIVPDRECKTPTLMGHATAIPATNKVAEETRAVFRIDFVILFSYFATPLPIAYYG